MGAHGKLSRNAECAAVCALVLSLLAFGAIAVLAGQQTESGYLESYIELLRSDIRTQRAALVARNMYLSGNEAKAFWPVYRDYEFEMSKANDARVELVRDYVRNHEGMDDKKAAELTRRWFDAEDRRTEVRLKYLEEFSAVLPGRTVARFFQVDRRIDLLIDLQIASELPMVK